MFDTDDPFWKQVWRFGNCLSYCGHRRDSEYGVYYGEIDGIKHDSAHRYSYHLHFGPIPDGKIVCHTCDNPPCVNPDHLFLGDDLDNMRDMCGKLRQNKGEDKHSAKLTEKQVLTIFDDQETPIKDLAASHNVSYATIYKIKRGWSWWWLLTKEGRVDPNEVRPRRIDA